MQHSKNKKSEKVSAKVFSSVRTNEWSPYCVDPPETLFWKFREWVKFLRKPEFLIVENTQANLWMEVLSVVFVAICCLKVHGVT